MHRSRVISIGNKIIGGGSPVLIQSMTNTKTTDVSKTVNQILQLESAGCELVRVAVPDKESAQSLMKIRERINIPLVADIHFNHKLALQALESGVDKLRINPGNIGAAWKVEEIANSARDKNVPIRIGVNSGSLPRKILKNRIHPDAAAMLEAAEKEIAILEKLDFQNIVVSLKSSDVKLTIEANRKFAAKYDYPIHLGITEAGVGLSAVIKSVLGIGILLEDGIGDTFRVSLTGDPVEEIIVCKELMKALGLLKEGINVIACPTCARSEFPVADIAQIVQEKFKDIKKPLTIAVMGCIVNGPGEAKAADIGVTGSGGEAIIFQNGKIVDKTPIDNIIQILEKHITLIVKPT